MNLADVQIICLVVMASTGMFVISHMLVNSMNDVISDYSWLIHLGLNLMTYCTVFIPGFFLYKFVQETKYIEKAGYGFIPKFIKSCYGSNDPDDEYDNALQKATTKPPIRIADPVRNNFENNFVLIVCAVGLQIFYLSWGVLQEKVMTQKYIDEDNKEYQFKDSQFLVFVNRILALVMAAIYILLFEQPVYYMPLYKYVFCSFSNIMSSWCQYEALKFVSFPTQVIAKASKVIPVMIMGKIISSKKFPMYEYATAVIMSIGMLLFMLETPESASHINKSTTYSGLTLLILYIVLDSFTSNWQDALFKKYHMSSVQMMFGVNLFSCVFTLISLLQQNQFFKSIYFMYKFLNFTMDCVLLSVCSAAGQLLIFYTIARFGSVTFALIMTVRQFFAVFLSCLIYKHTISYLGVSGVLLVFGSVFLRYYYKQRTKI